MRSRNCTDVARPAGRLAPSPPPAASAPIPRSAPAACAAASRTALCLSCRSACTAGTSRRACASAAGCCSVASVLSSSAAAQRADHSRDSVPWMQGLTNDGACGAAEAAHLSSRRADASSAEACAPTQQLPSSRSSATASLAAAASPTAAAARPSSPLTHARPASWVCSFGSARRGSTPRRMWWSDPWSLASIRPSASAHVSRSSRPPSLSRARATMESTTLAALLLSSWGCRSATTP
mmetsp:Transcript_22712/g.73548  ORF Transcript_22712/g.73548 Transcript_22712/m.73548 type:complete len:238 (-) Transcript_22712:269-982(-)|eukprot:scaffold13448_cov109-Isochrysis_galbana.AAC.3